MTEEHPHIRCNREMHKLLMEFEQAKRDGLKP